MKGFDVLAFDGEKAGKVVDKQGQYLIVEQGTIFKHLRALPEIFATVDEGEGLVRTTLSRNLIETAPEVEGHVDERAAALHYGLASGHDAPETLGYGELAPDDPAWTAEQQEQRNGLTSAAEQRAASHGRLRPGEGPNDRP
jgi:hypothetical protein